MTSIPSLRWLLLALCPCALGCPTVVPDDDAGDDDSAGDPPACEDGWLLDGDECVPEACGTGTWGDLDPAAMAVFVDAAAEDGGDGSQGAPLRRLQDGIDAAAGLGGGAVAVAAGTYLENVLLDDGASGVELHGRCTDLVVVDGSADPGASAITIDGTWGVSGVLLRDLTVTGDGEIGVWVESADVTLERVAIAGARPLGLLAYRASTEVLLRDVTIAGTRPDGNGDWGYAINVYEGAHLVAEDVVLEGNTGVAVLENGAATEVELRDAVVRDTATAPDGRFGWGLAVYNGAAMSCERCTVEGNAAAATMTGDEGSTLTLVDTVIADTVFDGHGEGGFGIAARDGAAVAATGCTLQRSHGNGVYLDGLGTVVQLTDSDILDTLGDEGGYFGQGVAVRQGGRFEMSGGEIAGSVIHGVYARDPDVVVVLDGVTVRDTQPDPFGEYGLGLAIHEGEASVTDCVFERNHGVGLLAFEGALLDVEGTAVRDTLAPPEWGYGRGIEAQLGATVLARGCVLEGNTEIGLLAYEGAHAVIEEVEILDTRPREATGDFGVGLAVESGASLEATSCRIEGSTDVAVFLHEPGTSAVLTDTVVRGTQPTAAGEYGRGIEVQDGATLQLHGCTLEDHAEVGLMALWEASVWITDTAVRGIHRSPTTAIGTGVAIEAAATLQATGLVAEQCEGPGLMAGDTTVVVCDGCALADNAFAGAVVSDGALTLLGGELRGTVPDANQGGGVGLYVAQPVHETAVVLDGVRVADNTYAGVWVDGPSAVELRGCELRGGDGVVYTYPSGETLRLHGDAVYATGGIGAWDGASGLLLEANQLLDSAGPAVFLDGASATLEGNTFAGNGVDLLQQACAGVAPPDGHEEAPAAELCPAYDWPTVAVAFDAYLVEHDPIE